MPKKNVKKVKLADLLGKEGKPNADLYKDDPKKRKNHVRNRTPRGRLIAVQGEYKRRLSGNAANDVKYYELAREFINNGFRQTKAYSAVFGTSISASRTNASKVFNSTWMRSLINEMLMGTDGEAAEPEKEYLLEKLMKQIESNVLDYLDDDGSFLNVKEIKALPKFAQQLIKKLDVHTWHEPLMEVLEEGGQPVEVGQIRHQKVHLELYDKQKALELLAKAMQWIGDNESGGTTYLTANVMIQANQRVDELRRDDLEGDYETVTTD